MHLKGGKHGRNLKWQQREVVPRTEFGVSAFWWPGADGGQGVQRRRRLPLVSRVNGNRLDGVIARLRRKPASSTEEWQWTSWKPDRSSEQKANSPSVRTEPKSTGQCWAAPQKGRVWPRSALLRNCITP